MTKPIKQINAEGLKLIEEFEGLQLSAYPDFGGILTIGYGHTRDVHSGQNITHEQAEAFLRQDVAEAEVAVNRLDLNLNDNQFSALVSFAFNLGPGNLRHLTSHGLQNIPDRILLYDHVGKKRVEGLTRRRHAERALFLKGVS